MKRKSINFIAVSFVLILINLFISRDSFAWDLFTISKILIPAFIIAFIASWIMGRKT
ncbi:hypothetical protein [Paenibacillus sedimenti]|uniref:Uncharacterized protein n=1 Tax=Paenibacillus sedimenti TaxID=2770274 RepID=A0A926KQD6_9BACL|nr:hypothetical protein [Paenibacillus sedimenti]MBD0382129.1 hypothetical protein [Paenibacillus sedimenti]